MKNKMLIVVAITGILMGGYGAKIYGEPKNITDRQIQNPNSELNQEKIAKGVLEDTGRTDLYNINDLEDVQVYFGNITEGDEKDVVVTVSFGPLNTVVAAYTKDGEAYEYVGDVGNFYEVKNIEFIPIPSLNKDVVIVDEFANQNVGAYEITELYRGFVFENGVFKEVLNTPTSIEAAWNQLWEGPEFESIDLWKKIIETSETKWEKEDQVALDIIRYQRYLTSDEGDKTKIPEADTFVEKDKRVVTEKYIWSDEWQRFIITQAVEEATGEPVAVIENRDASPYAMAGYKDNTYLIQRKNGSIDIINGEDLIWQ